MCLLWQWSEEKQSTRETIRDGNDFHIKHHRINTTNHRKPTEVRRCDFIGILMLNFFIIKWKTQQQRQSTMNLNIVFILIWIKFILSRYLRCVLSCVSVCRISCAFHRSKKSFLHSAFFPVADRSSQRPMLLVFATAEHIKCAVVYHINPLGFHVLAALSVWLSFSSIQLEIFLWFVSQFLLELPMLNGNLSGFFVVVWLYGGGSLRATNRVAKQQAKYHYIPPIYKSIFVSTNAMHASSHFTYVK